MLPSEINGFIARQLNNLPEFEAKGGRLEDAHVENIPFLSRKDVQSLPN